MIQRRAYDAATEGNDYDVSQMGNRRSLCRTGGVRQRQYHITA